MPSCIGSAIRAILPCLGGPPGRGAFGGVLINHTIHFVDLLRELFGPIRSLSARTSRLGFGLEVEDTAALWAEGDDGTLMTVSATLAAAGNASRLWFCFERVTVEGGADPYAPANDPWVFRARSPDDQARIDNALIAYERELPAINVEGFAGFFRAIYGTLRLGTAPPATTEQARATHELLAAAYVSAACGGAPQSLPLAPDHPGLTAEPMSVGSA